MFKRKHIKSLLSGLVLVLLCGSLVSSLMANEPTSPVAKDVEAAKRTAKAKAGGEDETLLVPKDVYISGTGLVEPRERESKISSATSGVIREIFVNEGDFVEQGAALARLDDELERARVDAAQAEVELAEAQLAKARRGNRSSEIEELMASARAVEAQRDQAERELERQQQLFDSKVIPKDALDRSIATRDQLQAQLKSAQARAQTSRLGARIEDINIARAQLKSAQARLAQSQQELARRKIMAPFAGEVLQLKFRLGEFYQPGAEPLLLLGDTRTLRVRLDVDERDIAKLAIGQRAQIQAISAPEKLFEGVVSEIGERMGRKNVRSDDPRDRVDTKILEVMISLDRSEGLVPGLRVRGYLFKPKA